MAIEEKLAIPAIILAAGMSQRMGRFKPMLPFGDRPMLARVVENLQAAEYFSPTILVTGHAMQEIMPVLSVYRIAFAHNPEYAMGGMLSSVQTGVRALPENCPAFLLALGDQPAVHPDTLRALVERFRSASAPITLPTFGGRRGHPVLFAAQCASEILALPAEATLKTVVSRHEAEIAEVLVPDEAILADVDTPEDYERALNLWQQRHRSPLP
jgi:CTP:molybdopterin cytidylyltransferase MocA